MALSVSDLPVMYSLLANSLSDDQNLRKQSEAALSHSENRTGFCSCLLEVIVAKDLVSNVEIRLMASVYLKNCVNRYWRSRLGASAINPEEKNHIRQKLLAHSREEHDQVAHVLSVIISKIVRIDYPKEWPDFFTVSAQNLQTADMIASHRIYLVLFRALKELSSKRLSSDQKIFSQISSQFFDYFWKLWREDLHNVLHGFTTLIQDPSPPTQFSDLHVLCQRWFLCLKILRQLIIFGFEYEMNNTLDIHPVKEVSHAFLCALGSLLPFFSSVHHELSGFSKKKCVKLMKILVAIQARHPCSFGDQRVLPQIIDFCLTKITDTTPNPDEILIQYMIMLKSVLECKEYKESLIGHVSDSCGGTGTVQKSRNEFSNMVSKVISSQFSNERVARLCGALIRRYFVLTEKDLDEWRRDPEQFHHDQNLIQWTERVRSCAEALYITLFERCSKLLSPLTVSALQESLLDCPPGATPPSITRPLLLKDAAYAATVYVSYELSRFLNFNDWFTRSLSLEIADVPSPTTRVIHRRVALILGHWVSEIRDGTRKPVYVALIRFLHDPDLCVKLAACRSLFLHMGDASFSEGDFFDLLPVFWESCFRLFDEVGELDSKIQVLNAVSSFPAAGIAAPFVEKLSLFFKNAWEGSDGESLLRIQLLVSLRNFVGSLGRRSPSAYHALIPILDSAVDVCNPDELNLLEDGVLLWETTMENAVSLVPQLLGLFRHSSSIVERGFDHLRAVASVVGNYVVLGGDAFLRRDCYSSGVACFLDRVVGNVSDRGLLSCLPVVDLVVRCCPDVMPPLVAGTLRKLVLRSVADREQDSPTGATVRTSCAAVVARVAVMNPEFFAAMASETNVVPSLIDTWMAVIDNATREQKKIIALALSLTLTVPGVLDCLDQILGTCTTVITGEKDVPGEPPPGGGSPEDEARRRNETRTAADPIQRLSLVAYVRGNLERCSSLHGEAFNVAIGRMHPSSLHQLRSALDML